MIVDYGSVTEDMARGNVISVKCTVQKLRAMGTETCNTQMGSGDMIRGDLVEVFRDRQQGISISLVASSK
jgi:hypothetical protein